MTKADDDRTARLARTAARLQKAAVRVETADAAAAAARVELREEIWRAAADPDGLSLSAIGRAAKISRQRVKVIVDEAPKD